MNNVKYELCRLLPGLPALPMHAQSGGLLRSRAWRHGKNKQLRSSLVLEVMRAWHCSTHVVKGSQPPIRVHCGHSDQDRQTFSQSRLWFTQ